MTFREEFAKYGLRLLFAHAFYIDLARDSAKELWKSGKDANMAKNILQAHSPPSLDE